MIQNDLNKEIGRRIRVIREQRGMTQQGLAERVGLKRTSITNIEGGKLSHISIVQLYCFASALEVSVIELLPQDLNNLDIERIIELRQLDQQIGALKQRAKTLRNK